MPRTIQEILDQQDELAAKFENFDPDLGHERPVEECLEARQLRLGRRIRIAPDDSSDGVFRHMAYGPLSGGRSNWKSVALRYRVEELLATTAFVQVVTG